ncbi:MAG: glycosyltransferase family 4 protein [Candidatus Hodarchaeota archaeon]
MSINKSDRRHILFVIDNLSFGGGERVFAQIINGLLPKKYEIFVASLPSEQFDKAIHNNRVQFLPIDFSKRLNFSLIPRLAKIINKNKIEIVHGQGARAEFYARLACKLAGISKYVSTIAMPVEGFDVGFLRKKIYALFDRFSEKFVDRFLVVSDVLREAMIRDHGIPAEKIIRIYNGIEIDHYLPQEEDGSREGIRREFNVGKDTAFIGAIGRLVWQKGFEYLIQAIPHILREFAQTKVLIVGEGPLRKELEALGKSMKIEGHLVFSGFRSDVKEILSAIDILVVPSLLEGFPMITLEAMAMGKPIIASDIDGIREQIIDGESGILIPPKDLNAIGEAIIKLNRDEKLAQNMGWEARKRVEKEFSVEKMVTTTEQVYQSLIPL